MKCTFRTFFGIVFSQKGSTRELIALPSLVLSVRLRTFLSARWRAAFFGHEMLNQGLQCS